MKIATDGKFMFFYYFHEHVQKVYYIAPWGEFVLTKAVIDDVFL